MPCLSSLYGFHFPLIKEFVVSLFFLPEQSYSRRQFIYAAAVLVIMFAIFRLLIEISQVFTYRDTKSLMDLKQKKQKGYYWHNLQCYWRYWRYFHDWENWMEIVMILFAIMFASVFNAECLCAHQWQWQIGTIAVFLAWSDFILFLQTVPALGIYVVMLVDIVKRFIKAVPIILMLVLAFGFGFFMLFFEPGNLVRLLHAAWIVFFTVLQWVNGSIIIQWNLYNVVTL